jgi:hypothetical protein
MTLTAGVKPRTKARAGDVVPERKQLRDGAVADYAGRTADEDLHGNRSISNDLDGIFCVCGRPMVMGKARHDPGKRLLRGKPG